MFTSLVVARAAGEGALTWERILSAILRTEQVGRFCEDAGIAISALLPLADEAQAPSFRACMEKIEAELAERGHTFGLREHVDSLQPLPIVEARQLFVHVEMFFDGAPKDAPMTPLHLLGALVEKPEIAAMLAAGGLTQELVHNALNAREAGEY
jgi:hypothetical protein